MKLIDFSIKRRAKYIEIYAKSPQIEKKLQELSDNRTRSVRLPDESMANAYTFDTRSLLNYVIHPSYPLLQKSRQTVNIGFILLEGLGSGIRIKYPHEVYSGKLLESVTQWIEEAIKDFYLSVIKEENIDISIEIEE